MARLPRFRKRVEWFLKYRPHLLKNLASLTEPGQDGRYVLSIVNREQLVRVLERMLDPKEFLSEYGLRALSREYEGSPFRFSMNGQQHTVAYEPAESTSAMFGGNSNWRGPIWFPVNFLMIESLQKYHHYYGDALTVEFQDGRRNLNEVATMLSQRLINIFRRDDVRGRRPFYGNVEVFQQDPHWRDCIQFYEYFHGDNGAGVGASHQTGWTALVAKLIQQCAEKQSVAQEEKGAVT